MGWNRLVEKEQDIAIITWFEILVDAGVPFERWTDCYRSAQQRRNELLASAQTVDGMLKPADLVVEWQKIKDFHNELDESHLLPANAVGACKRCTKEGLEIHADGSIGGVCDHRPLTSEEIEAAARQRTEFLTEMRRQAHERAELHRKAQEEARRREEEAKPKGDALACSGCNRTVTTLAGWTASERCGVEIVNLTCPKCATETMVRSQGKLVCRECFGSFDIPRCEGTMQAA